MLFKRHKGTKKFVFRKNKLHKIILNLTNQCYFTLILHYFSRSSLPISGIARRFLSDIARKIPHHSRHLSSLFFRRYSIDTPSLVHRYSIVSMDNRWSSDGLSMEMQWSNLGLTITNRRREICITIVKISEFPRPSRKFIFISAFHN